jgi:hypothetical protein
MVTKPTKAYVIILSAASRFMNSRLDFIGRFQQGVIFEFAHHMG